MRKYAWGVVNLTLIVATIGAGYLVVQHRQDIQDWWELRSYSPPTAIARIASDTTMINHGRDMFYVSRPQIEDSQTFNQHCSNRGEKSLVLGCYVGQRIHVFNVTDTRLNGVVEVTAAHEMLHAAYERLDGSARKQLDSMVEAELPKVTDDRLKNLIKIYQEQEPGQLLNEMHSILGTEYANLSPELETYYKQFFSDRSKVVDIANQYQAVFVASQNHIAALESQMNDLKKQIDANTAIISQRKAQIDQQSRQLTQQRSTNPAAYNAAVPGFNNQVRAYNSLVVFTQGLIDQYNKLVNDHNSEAAAQNELYHSLDSHYQTVQ